MKILFMAHRIPYPPNKGDKIRTFNEIKHLSRKHEVHLITLADDSRDLKYKKDLESYCARVAVCSINKKIAKLRSMIGLLFSGHPLSVHYFYEKSLQKIVDEWLVETDYDAVVCFSSPMAEYLFRSKTGIFKRSATQAERIENQPVLVMDFCDVDSQKWHQYAKNSRFPMRIVYGIESRRLLIYEKKISRIFDHSVFVSGHEVDVYKALDSSARNIHAIPNGVDYEYFSPAADFDPVGLRDHDGQKVLVFTGAMDYYANVEGVSWFCSSILPLIKEYHPDLLFYIVGSNPGPEVQSLEAIQGVRVTGFVEDIRPYYGEADVCVIPLRIAAGVQNKVLEAMSMERPVVTTTKAFEGVQGTPSVHAMVADDPVSFAKKVSDLLAAQTEKVDMAKNARNFIIENYNWQTNMKLLENLVSLKSAAN